jgi:hypothetical protein
MDTYTAVLLMKQQFRERVRVDLEKVPLTMRRNWTEREVRAWWDYIKLKHPTIERGLGSGDSWPQAKSACDGLYGKRAVI